MEELQFATGLGRRQLYKAGRGKGPLLIAALVFVVVDSLAQYRYGAISNKLPVCNQARHRYRILFSVFMEVSLAIQSGRLLRLPI